MYIMGSRLGVLYIGVTNDLERRVYEHRKGLTPGFTKKYRVRRLLYLEMFDRPGDAIAREKQLKGWTRARKLDLIHSMNPRNGRSERAQERARSFAALRMTEFMIVRALSVIRDFFIRHPERSLRSEGSRRRVASVSCTTQQSSVAKTRK